MLELRIKTTEDPPTNTNELLKSPLLFSDYNTLMTHANEVIVKLQEMGYIDSRIVSVIEDEKEGEKKPVSVLIYIGQQIYEITVLYNPDDFSKKEIATVANSNTNNSFTLDVKKIKTSIAKLQTIKTEKGDPFASIQLKDFARENGKLSARIFIETSKKRHIDSIVIKGYEKMPLSFVKHHAGIKKGMLFSEKKIKEKNNILDALPFLKSIKPPEVLFKKDSTQVYLYFEKRKNNTFDGILGFNTNEETNNLEFNGYLDLQLNNNLNYGEQLSIYYKADGREQLNFEIATTLPYLFKSPIGVTASLGLFRRDSTFINTTLKTRLNYQINPSIATNLGYENNVSTDLRNESNNTNVTDYSSNFITSGFSYNKTQTSELFPTKTLFNVEIGLGNRKTEANTQNQIKIQGRNSYIFNFNSKNSLYLYNETGFLSSDDYFENELFRFGGITNIRGFNENSIDASFYSVLATEYRYLFSPNLYINSIIDLGYFENTLTSIETNLYSFGMGLGLLTKTGLLRFALANGTANQNNFSFQNTKIHISLVSNF